MLPTRTDLQRMVVCAPGFWEYSPRIIGQLQRLLRLCTLRCYRNLDSLPFFRDVVSGIQQYFVQRLPRDVGGEGGVGQIPPIHDIAHRHFLPGSWDKCIPADSGSQTFAFLANGEERSSGTQRPQIRLQVRNTRRRQWFRKKT